MERNNETFISVQFTKDDYINLELSMKSPHEKWRRAVDIFKDRIEGRYLNVIHNMCIKATYDEIMQDGFVIMAIECLLIETLMQFRNGYDTTPRGGNKIEYRNFLRKALPNEFAINVIADKFYSDIRCGILHSAQTKNGSQLTYNKDTLIEILPGGSIRVDIYIMMQCLENYFIYYIDSVLDEKQSTIRLNFLNKMNFICGLPQE